MKKRDGKKVLVQVEVKTEMIRGKEKLERIDSRRVKVGPIHNLWGFVLV